MRMISDSGNKIAYNWINGKQYAQILSFCCKNLVTSRAYMKRLYN